jgi:hypothetical protein
VAKLPGGPATTIHVHGIGLGLALGGLAAERLRAESEALCYYGHIPAIVTADSTSSIPSPALAADLMTVQKKARLCE